MFWQLICKVHLTVYFYHVTYEFQSERTLCSCPNVKELLAWNRPDTWILSDSNEIRTHNHLVRKRKLNNLAKLAKWLNSVVSTYLYGAFDCMVLSSHERVSEWIHSEMCRFTLKVECRFILWNAYVIRWEHTGKCTAQISFHNTAQSFSQFG